jgi:DNA-binding NtrC family response regulator
MSKALRILVVDDESELANLTAECLSLDGHQAISCDSPMRAIELGMSQQFDVVVSDVAMPQLTGPDMMKKWFDAAKGAGVPPVIFVTGHTDFQSVEIVGVRVLGVLNKPAAERDLATLLAKI